MSCLQTVEQADRLFPYSRWTAQLRVLAGQYRKGNPVPHVLLSDFLEPEVADTIAKEFPDHDTHAWTLNISISTKTSSAKWRNENSFPTVLGEVTDELNLRRVLVS